MCSARYVPAAFAARAFALNIKYCMSHDGDMQLQTTFHGLFLSHESQDYF
jgi:hypothetical protein